MSKKEFKSVSGNLVGNCEMVKEVWNKLPKTIVKVQGKDESRKFQMATVINLAEEGDANCAAFVSGLAEYAKRLNELIDEVELFVEESGINNTYIAKKLEDKNQKESLEELLGRVRKELKECLAAGNASVDTVVDLGSRIKRFEKQLEKKELAKKEVRINF